MSDAKGWDVYYRKTAGRPPRPTLLFALDRFAAPGFAVDLGCGEGRDTIELLRRGWHVLGIDSEPGALARLAARPDLPPGHRLDTSVARFEDAAWPAADLVNASFALFFCAPAAFPPLWRKIGASLKPAGRFAGQLLGERDSWASRPNVVAHDPAALSALLAGFAVEMHEIEETDGVTPRGEAKHWHIHHLVIRRL
ncbi:MAG: class I SAM-dependent methyltransferase [Stellaceae bacterium]